MEEEDEEEEQEEEEETAGDREEDVADEAKGAAAAGESREHAVSLSFLPMRTLSLCVRLLTSPSPLDISRGQ